MCLPQHPLNTAAASLWMRSLINNYAVRMVTESRTWDCASLIVPARSREHPTEYPPNYPRTGRSDVICIVQRYTLADAAILSSLGIDAGDVWDPTPTPTHNVTIKRLGYVKCLGYVAPADET